METRWILYEFTKKSAVFLLQGTAPHGAMDAMAESGTTKAS